MLEFDLRTSERGMSHGTVVKEDLFQDHGQMPVVQDDLKKSHFPVCIDLLISVVPCLVSLLV